MNKKVFLLVVLLCSLGMLNAQIVAISQLNSTSFCGVNSVLTIEDVSTGGADARTWTVNGPGGFTSFSGTNLIENVTLTAIGAYSVKIQACNSGTMACEDSTITVNVFPNPTAVITISDSIVCFGTTVQFNAFSSTFTTPSITYAWDNDFGTGIDETSASFTFLANEDKVIMLAIVDDNNCIDTTFQNLFILQNEEAEFDITDQCAGIPFELKSYSTLSNSALDSIYWEIDGTTYLVGEQVMYTHPVADTIFIINYVVNNFGCSDGIQKKVIIEAMPVVQLNINDTTICPGEPLQFIATGADSYAWEINGLDSNILDITLFETTDIEVAGSSISGVCPSDIESVKVSVLEVPEIKFESENFNPTMGTPLNIGVKHVPQFSTKDSLIWLPHNTSNELEYTYGFKNNFVANETVTFPVQLIYNKGIYKCKTDTSVTFNINEDCTAENIYVSNTFTPNNDGLNDRFVISGYTINIIEEFVIFNRAGQIVFSAENIAMKNGKSISYWDGLNQNNIKCSTGVYVYQYKAKCLNGGDVISSGNVTLVR